MEALGAVRIDAAPLTADPVNVGALVATLPQLAGLQLRRVEATPVTGAGSPVVKQTSWAGDGSWITNLLLANVDAPNGALLTMQDSSVLASGAELPQPLVRLAGAALGAHVAVPTEINLEILFSRGGPQDFGPIQFGAIVNDATDTLPDLSVFIDALEATLKTQRSWSIGVGAGGVDVQALTAQFAGLSASGVIWVRAGQVGNQPYQIPATVLNNDVSHYRFFPSVFVRRVDYVANLYATSPAKASPITTLAGALPIFEVIRRPTHSRWVLTVDGVPRDLVVAHGAGDYRTPLEIWNSVLVPQLQAGTLQTFEPYATSPTTRAFARTGSVWNTAYVDAAAFVEPLDDQTAPIAVYVPQT